MISVLWGLLSALSWGGADFAGGLSSRRIGAYRAVFYCETVGLVLLVAAIPFVEEPAASWTDLLLALAAGLIGSFSLMLLYKSMIHGKMSIAMPVSALLAATIPIFIGAFAEGLPGATQLIGFMVALAAVWLISQESGSKPRIERWANLRLPFLSGLGIGLYFVLLHQASQQTTLWPMLAARIGGVICQSIFIIMRRESLRVNRTIWPMIAANAGLDVVGNLFYVLAGQAGRMDVAAVISSLYPGATVFLAWLFLKEHISRWQAVGILFALVAISLMTL